MKRATQATETPQVGRSVPRLESWLKVTGRAEYVHNLRLPGMLYGKIFRSSVAHGRIKRIDVSAARAVAGVHSVVTAAEVKTVVRDPYYGPAFHDQPGVHLVRGHRVVRAEHPPHHLSGQCYRHRRGVLGDLGRQRVGGGQ